jgi:uncharacterized repeat protein (TIGR02543 family)
MTLYAAWDINRYTVSFDVNNPAYSGAPIQAQTVESGSIAHHPESLSEGSMYTNYGTRKFLGWFVNLSDTAPYDFQRPVTANLTLHAKWEQLYRVEFANTHESQIAAQYVPSGGRATRPSPDPTGPVGYTFHGWSASPNAFVVADTPGANSAPFDFANTPITTDTAIYGVWSPDIWSIEFNANGGTFADGGTSPKSAEYIPANGPPTNSNVGDPVRPYAFLASRDVPANPARLGYSFTGWRGASDGTGAQLPADGTVITGNAVYYSIWQLETYDIDYNLVGGMVTYANPDTYRVTDHFPITFNAPQRTGYTFTGWTCDYEDAVETNPDDTTAPAISFALTQGVTEDVTLTAHWRANTYRVNYYGNSADSGTMVADAVNFGTAFTLKANAFVKPGYSFIGWNTVADGSGKAYADRFSFADGSSGQNAGAGWDLTSDLSLFAQWAPETYTLTFDKNTSDERAQGASPTGRAVTFGSSIGMLPGVGGYGAAPTRPDYVFIGWAYTPDGKSPDVQPTDIYALPTDSAVYAIWELPPPTYGFTRNAGSGGTVSGTPSGSYAAGTSITVTATPNSGYKFTGWTANGVSIAGGSSANPATFAMPPNAVSLTANFEADAAAAGGAGGAGAGSTAQIPNVAKIRTPLNTIYLTKGKSYKLAYVLDGPDGKPIDDPYLAATVPKAKKASKTAVAVSWAKKGSAGIYRIKAKNVGKAVITIKAQNGKALRIKVVVQKKKVALRKFTVKLPAKLKRGKSYQIKLSKLTKKASDITAVTFKSSKKSVATVDAAGKVTALKKGKAKITIKVGKRKIVKAITVK